MATWITADEIMQKKSEYSKLPWKFPNEVLGLTYEGASKPISITKLLRCRVDPTIITKGFKHISIGIDWGNQSHYVVLGTDGHEKRYLMDYGILENVQALEHAIQLNKLADIWQPNIGIMDSGYGKVQTQAMFKLKPGKFHACFYKDSAFMPEWETITNGPDGLPLAQQDYQYHVTVNHTMMCDAVLNGFDYGTIGIPIDINDDLVPGVSKTKDMLDNLCLARVIVSDSSRSVTAKRRWVITKAHFFAALCYAWLGIDELLKDDNPNGADGFFVPKKFW